MAFENKTVESINTLIIDGLEQELNVKFRLLPKSFIRVLAKVLSGVYISLYKMQAYIFLQMFVDTATFDEIEVLGKRIRPLCLWGDLVGVGSPAEATQWEGTCRVKVTAVNTYLMKGTQFKNSATGKVYLTTETRLLANSYETIAVRCSETGTAGNLVIGDILMTVSPLSNIDRNAAVMSVEKNAVNAESEASYRARVKQRWRVQPQGGSLADYRRWSSEVAGILNTYIYKDPDTASGVLIYVSCVKDVSPDRVPPSGLLKQVGEACSFDPETGEARKPIGAVLDPEGNGSYSNIRPVSISSFDVYINNYNEIELDEFQTQCKGNIESYFLQREPYVRGLSVDNDRTDRISVSNLVSIANDVAEGLTGYFESVVLKYENVEINSYTLGYGELAVLGNLYINGVPV